jgi:hypothetical protein
MSWGRAVSGNRLAVVQFLGALAADVKDRDAQHVSPAQAACMQEQVVVAKSTIESLMKRHPGCLYNFSISAHANEDGGGFVSVSYGFTAVVAEGDITEVQDSSTKTVPTRSEGTE